MAPPHPGSPGQRAAKRARVCVCVLSLSLGRTLRYAAAADTTLQRLAGRYSNQVESSAQ